jgi:hypothetical protein
MRAYGGVNILGPHKLLDNFIRSYFELEMCHDIKICVKYNTVNVHLNSLNTAKAILQEKHTSLFDKMAALPIECSWCVLEFARNNSVVTVQRVFRWQFGRRGSPASSI